MLLAPVLNVLAHRPIATDGTVYTNTAFLSMSGNDSSAVFNNPARPFRTLTAAIQGLYEQYASFDPTTIEVKGNYTIGGSDIPATTALDTRLTAGLTVKGYNGIPVVVNGVFPFGSQSNAILHLRDIRLSELRKSLSTTTFAQNAGTVIGNGDGVVVDTITCNGNPGADGPAGVSVANSNGAGGSNGSNGSPPGNGSDGESANASGGTGLAGQDGCAAWSINLDGSLNISAVVTVIGGAGGSGGAGGVAATATGGHGGSGGNGLDDGLGNPYSGGNGGNGGNASADGGNGGNGGVGGNGGTIFYGTGVNITSYQVYGGAGGAGGSGTPAGNANPGDGGSPGFGVNGGSDGATGGIGSTSTSSGSAGTPGVSGSDGSLVSL